MANNLQTPRLRASIDLIEVARGLQVLARPARGEHVRIVQAALRDLGLFEGRADGAFGPATTAAVRRFQRSKGLRELGHLNAATLLAIDQALLSSNARPMTAASPLDVLHSAPAHTSTYHQVLAAWPAHDPIWPHLTTVAAREQLIRYIAQVDDTDKRPYQSFDNLCTGFAVQVYARFSARAALDATSLANLTKVDIDGKPAAAKLRVPLFAILSSDHAFCAFLVDETAPEKLASYRLLEPQNDQFVTPGTRSWQTYVERFGVILFDLAACDAQGRFDFRPVRSFVSDSQGRMTGVPSVGVVRFLRDLMVTESVVTNYKFYVVDQPPARRGFVNFIRHQARNVWRLSDAELLAAGRLVIGRPLRSHPDRAFTVMTADHYVALINRQDLRGALPGARSSVAIERL